MDVGDNEDDDEEAEWEEEVVVGNISKDEKEKEKEEEDKKKKEEEEDKKKEEEGEGEEEESEEESEAESEEDNEEEEGEVEEDKDVMKVEEDKSFNANMGNLTIGQKREIDTEGLDSQGTNKKPKKEFVRNEVLDDLFVKWLIAMAKAPDFAFVEPVAHNTKRLADMFVKAFTKFKEFKMIIENIIITKIE